MFRMSLFPITTGHQIQLSAKSLPKTKVTRVQIKLVELGPLRTAVLTKVQVPAEKMLPHALAEEATKEAQSDFVPERFLRPSSQEADHPRGRGPDSRAIRVGRDTQDRTSCTLLELSRVKQGLNASVAAVPATVVAACQPAAWNHRVGDQVRDVQGSSTRLPQPPHPIVVFERSDAVLNPL